ncbi:hypothetical protein QE109_02420 [Fusibacter bizertensis]|uniref:Uncharacterized protein n=1 Tax=Fusibacter bizertensis TaxID=1488331 RepID=A0ABT6N988_9FIRM|nr:hypothetical protein [Fusibacter bizertensis]MDH8676982.1 hypothetical protein [Fusibacter bizertensis]
MKSKKLFSFKEICGDIKAFVREHKNWFLFLPIYIWYFIFIYLILGLGDDLSRQNDNSNPMSKRH